MKIESSVDKISFDLRNFNLSYIVEDAEFDHFEADQISGEINPMIPINGEFYLAIYDRIKSGVNK